MSDADLLNLKLENIHKSVKVKTKPSKVQTSPPKKHATTIKPKQEIKQENSPAHGMQQNENNVPDDAPKEIPQNVELMAQAKPEVHEENSATKKEHKKEIPKDCEVVDLTLYRNHKVKNTFNSVFPAYGLCLKGEGFTSETKDMSKDLDKAEPIDWSNHMKSDSVKRYTEEMLKAANMRGKKK